MTICQIKRNDAEARVHAMAQAGWTSAGAPKLITTDEGSDEATEGATDLEQVARDQIAGLIQAKFMGHGMARLVDAVLQAQGYTTHVSPPGPDKGIDILAAPGPLGFGQPRICVQVKSGNTPTCGIFAKPLSLACSSKPLLRQKNAPGIVVGMTSA